MRVKKALVILFIVAIFFKVNFQKEEKKIEIKDSVKNILFCNEETLIYKDNKDNTIFYNLKFLSHKKNKNNFLCEINENNFLVEDLESKKKIVDKFGLEIQNFSYKEYKRLGNNLFIFDNKYLYNTETKKKINMDSRYKVGLVSDNTIPIVDILTSKVGYLSDNGEVLIPIQYEGGTFFKNGYAIVKDGKDIKIINKSNKTIFVTQKMDKIQLLSDKTILITNESGGIIYDFKSKKILIKSEYMKRLKDNQIIYTKNNNFGMVDNFGEVRLNALYDEIGEEINGSIILFKNNKYFIKNLFNNKNSQNFDILLRKENYFITIDYETGEYIFLNNKGENIIKNNFLEFTVLGDFILGETQQKQFFFYKGKKLLKKFGNKDDILYFTKNVFIFRNKNGIEIYKK